MVAGVYIAHPQQTTIWGASFPFQLRRDQAVLISVDRNGDCKLIVDDVGKLEDGVHCYAKESSSASHPRADLWFEATDESDGGVKLVLVKIGGTGQKDKAGDKIKAVLQTAEQPRYLFGWSGG